MFSMMIPTDKIKDVIGKGGKVIQDICATCNCKIDVQEDGHVFVSAVDQEDAKRAIFTIKTIVEDPEIGAIYKGKVTRLMNFGAFVEIAPGKEGLVHISKLDTKRCLLYTSSTPFLPALAPTATVWPLWSRSWAVRRSISSSGARMSPSLSPLP